jgi:phage gpG-like protein
MARAVSARINWYGPKVSRKLQSIASRNLDRAAEFLSSQIKRSMKSGGGGYPPKRSAPGQVPFIQTGRLRNSIFWRKKRNSREVGTNLIYGVAHETGTKRYVVTAKRKKVLADRRANIIFGKSVTIKLPKRPFIMPAFIRNKKRIGKIIATGRV